MTIQTQSIVADGDVLKDSAIARSDAEHGRVAFAPSVVQVARSDNVVRESMVALRNHLINNHVRDGRRALAVCAPKAGSGCTYVSVNLAVAMAQAGLNTLLIDGNLRDPAVDTMITPLGGASGFAQYLGASDGDGPLVVGDVVPNLSILYAGGAANNAQELLSSARLKTLFDDSVRTFDLTIVDCPPAANYSDARRIASLLRHAIVVVRRNHSLAHDVKALVSELRADRVNVVGTVLNVVD